MSSCLLRRGIGLRAFTIVFGFILFSVGMGSLFAEEGFVKRVGSQFELDGKPYRFVGANFWAAMNIAVEDLRAGQPHTGRLARELDRLKALGATNLRILAASEGPVGSPLRIAPLMQLEPGIYDEEVLKGLDLVLFEMQKRQMKAVMILNNFWHFSGGMAQYLNWVTREPIPYPPPYPGGSWGTYQNYTAKFYANEKATSLYENFIRMLVLRKNSYTGEKYKDDSAIMTWQLANEPRGLSHVTAFNRWIESTANLIRSLDSRHLITTGSEGEASDPTSVGLDLIRNHAYQNIDYATAHVWAQNWGWYDPEKAKQTYAGAAAKMRAYVRDQTEKARKLNKPLVFEEFGLAREGQSFDPQSDTTYRDLYYKDILEEVVRAIADKAPLVGINFWAWAGEGRPKVPYGSFWRPGDPFIGDPAQEPQGWYSIYDSDRSTLEIIQNYADRISR